MKKIAAIHPTAANLPKIIKLDTTSRSWQGRAMKKKAKSKSRKRTATSKSYDRVETSTPGEFASSESASTPPRPAPPAEAHTAKGPKAVGKPASSSPKRRVKKTARRYSSEQKAEIIQFVRDHDAANGRGGKSAAVRKFGVNALTLSNWIKSSKGAKNEKSAGKGKTGRTPKSSKSGTSLPSPATSIDATLGRLLEIRNQIDALTTEFEVLKKLL